MPFSTSTVFSAGVPSSSNWTTITGLGLKEAKDLVEGAPSTVKEAVSKADAGKIKKQLADAGAEVEVK